MIEDQQVFWISHEGLMCFPQQPTMFQIAEACNPTSWEFEIKETIIHEPRKTPWYRQGEKVIR